MPRRGTGGLRGEPNTEPTQFKQAGGELSAGRASLAPLSSPSGSVQVARGEIARAADATGAAERAQEAEQVFLRPY